jgi:transcriptional regulator
MSATSDNSLLQGSLDLLILRTLVGGAKHGYAIARHIHLVSDEALRVEEGSLYPALHRMERRGWIEAEWGASESNRRAKFYSLTRRAAVSSRRKPPRGRVVTAVGKVLDAAPGSARARSLLRECLWRDEPASESRPACAKSWRLTLSGWSTRMFARHSRTKPVAAL